MRKHLIWVLFIFLIPALACGLGGSNKGGEGASQANLAAEEAPGTPAPAEETVVEEVEAVEEIQAEPEMEESSSGEFTGVSGLNDLSSYRVNFIMEFDGQSGGQPSQGRIEMTMEETKNPPASHLMMTMEGDTVEEVGGANEMDIYMMGDTVYMKNAVLQLLSQARHIDDGRSHRGIGCGEGTVIAADERLAGENIRVRWFSGICTAGDQNSKI